jgi:hypothetical protein
MKDKGIEEKELNNEILMEKVRICWFLTSIFHDIGYPIQKTSKLFRDYLIKILTGKKKVEKSEEVIQEEWIKHQLSISWANVLGFEDRNVAFDYYKTKLYELICEHVIKGRGKKIGN